MTKQIKNKKSNWITIIFFASLLIMGIYASYLFLDWVLNDDPEFKITKEECYNETFSIPLPDEQRDTLFEEYRIIGNFVEKFRCLKEFKEICSRLIDQQNRIVKTIQSNEISQEMESCEQVEVDEIILSSYFLFVNYDFNNETLLIPFSSCEETPNLEVKCNIPFGKILDPSTDEIPNIDILVSSPHTRIAPIKISKEDLSIDWLSEKAKCIEYDLYYGRGKCSKYKLGNYRIEVFN